MSELDSLLNTVSCCSALELLARLPDASIDCVVTSPPYDNLRTYNGYSFDFQPIARETYRVLKPGGVCVWVVRDAVVNGSETLTSMRQALYFVDVCGFRMHDTMIWRTENTVFPDPTRYTQQFDYMFVFSKGQPKSISLIHQPNKHAGSTRPLTTSSSRREPDGSVNVRYGKHVKETSVMGNVWLIDAGYLRTTKDLEAYQHPAMFPEELARRHIETWTNAGDLVLDYFGGSGTTAKMARQFGRNYITCDISAEYCDLMRKRLALPFTPLFPAFL